MNQEDLLSRITIDPDICHVVFLIYLQNILSKQLGLSPSTVKRKIKLLKKQSLLKRIGSDKSSYWSIRE